MPARDLNDQERALLQEMERKWKEAESFRRPLQEKWLDFHARYHNYAEFRNQWQNANPRDRYDMTVGAKRTWGADLHIPYAFRTVETVVPRILANPPRMKVVPGARHADENVENMKALIDFQQDHADYELTAQDTAKSGLIYGLGVQKNYWRLEQQNRKRVDRRPFPMNTLLGEYVVREGIEDLYNDPYSEDVDIWNFMWDPTGHDMRTIGWAFHRTWRSTGYCLDRLEQGLWDFPLKVEDLENTGSPQKFTESWDERLSRQQLGGSLGSVGKGNIHEVWEFHDRARVVTILDRKWPARTGENPAWHKDLPFSIYRPTRIPHQFCGKGEIEPIMDLTEELDTLRSQRRDNATIVLQRTFAYARGFVDERDLQLGPGMAIPVDGDPSDLIYPLPVGDIPNSTYKEEDGLKADIEMATGVSDAVAGGDAGPSSTTATAAQLGQQAANERIKLKARLLTVECVRRTCQQWIDLNQQKILTDRDVRIPYTPSPGEPDQAWRWIKVSPAELAGPMEAQADAGVTTPDNVPQMRQDAQMLWQMFSQDPNVELPKLVLEVFKLMGVQEPERFIKQGDPGVPPAAIDNIVKMWTDEMNNLAAGLVRKGLMSTKGQRVLFDPTQLPPELQNPDAVIRKMVGQAVQDANQSSPQPLPVNGNTPGGPPQQLPQGGEQ